jgi:DNA-binding protein WhiA
VSSRRIRLETENPAIALLFTKLVREAVGLRDKSEAVLTTIEDADLLSKLYTALRLTEASAVPDPDMIRCEFCHWSFAKGLFLACGTITQPDNAYHMEFLLRNEESALGIAAFLTDLGVPPKITERRGGLCGVYYKDSESVVDILGHLGANRAAFKMLDAKIIKEIRNNANRVANCEAANIGKTVAAANEQMKAIQTIITSGRADELPDELKQTLDLRAAFPNDTLLELAAKHQPPITKSGVNHRLKRLVDFSLKC